MGTRIEVKRARDCLIAIVRTWGGERNVDVDELVFRMETATLGPATSKTPRKSQDAAELEINETVGRLGMARDFHQARMVAAATRKSGKMSATKWLKTLDEIDRHVSKIGDVAMTRRVLYCALSTYVERHRDKSERYLVGIVRSRVRDAIGEADPGLAPNPLEAFRAKHGSDPDPFTPEGAAYFEEHGGDDEDGVDLVGNTNGGGL